MYKLHFKLKQHTPLIHFQHNQHGATLRATELKPKLDKFLIKKLGIETCKNNNWLIKGQDKALDYKVRIENVKDENSRGILKKYYFESRISNDDFSSVKIEIENNVENEGNIEIIAPSAYFANNDKRNNKEYEKIILGLLWTGEIKLTITCFIKSLRKEITNKFLEEFFVVNNFGNRQSKGFGSFTLAGTNDKTFKNLLETNFSFYKKIKTNSKNIYKDIDNKWKNLKNNAAKNASAIRSFFADKGVEWEKKFVTEQVVRGNSYTAQNDGDEIKYVRALLGLAELHDYQQLKKKVKIEHAETDKDKKIDRFQSPIIFKVFEKNIYAVPNTENIDKIKGEEFYFYVGDKLSTATSKEKIKVPNKFDLKVFLRNN